MSIPGLSVRPQACELHLIIAEPGPSLITKGWREKEMDFGGFRRSITSPNTAAQNEVMDIHLVFWSFLLLTTIKHHMNMDLKIVS